MFAKRIYAGLLCLVLASGCGGGGVEEATDEMVVDEMESIEDGHFVAYKLDPGTYKVELTASGDGATVKWVGSSCPGAPKRTPSYTVTCEMTGTGQLIVENPASQAAGSTTVTVKVTRVAG